MITVEKLKELKDCKEQVELFDTIADIQHASDFDRDWAAGKLLSEEGRKKYQEIVAQHWKTYQEIVALLYKEYDEAIAPYWKTYKEATVPFRKAYQEAKARIFAELYLKENES